MRFDLRALVVLTVLLATSASAQPIPEGGLGIHGVYGTASPERILFPANADPDVIVGFRLSPQVDVQIGAGRTTHERTTFLRDEVAVLDEWEQTKALAVGAGYTDRHGPALVRGRLSLGYDDFAASYAAYRPDSIRVFTRDGPTDAYALTTDDFVSIRGTFVHLGGSAAVAAPLRFGRVSVTPSVGASGSLSSRTGGTKEAQGARWMPFAQIPVGVRIGEVTVTTQMTAGVVFGQDEGATLFRRWTAADPGSFVLDGAFRVDF